MHHDAAFALHSEDHEPANPSLAKYEGGTSVEGCIGMHDLLDGQNQAEVLCKGGGTMETQPEAAHTTLPVPQH